ncbi:DUF4269 domain-containing protein [Hymenobacter sp. BT18]|uniref:DUF4269 domain-containing protein n=1 Tax=Hymenobacter sp. BT18 TaxID=2835648 RepID=UPI00143E47E7|nr:DUF4269 domain-containing protein [Hymenobacter sp. BT18]QIX61694.1 DUF4269 domain-containing protein [Hymenobacter sp. BT18]
MPPRNWHELDYLRTGPARQQQAYAALQSAGIWSLLNEFRPTLAGTVPLDVDIASSDLDVLCEVPTPATAAFQALLRRHFGTKPGFALAQPVIDGFSTTLCQFQQAGFAVEIFGQARPVAAQNGFRHLLVEDRILQLGGPAWRTAVRQLKQQGMKTEPAFARLLELPGNPYAALLALEDLSEAQLHALVMARTAHIGDLLPGS